MNNDLLKAIEMIKGGLNIIDNYNHTEIEEGLKVGDEIDESVNSLKNELSYLIATLKEV